MMTLREFYDSLYSRSKNDQLNEDDFWFSLDDIYSSKRTTSSTSIFNTYAFSDDEEVLHGSLASLYFDDVPVVDMNEEATTHKKDTTQQKQSASRPTSGALEELFAPAGSLKSSNTKDGSLSSSPKSRSLPAMLELNDGNHTSFSARGNYVWEVDQDDRETDTDDEGLEFGSDSNEVSLLHRKSAIREALALAMDIRPEDKIPRTPRKSSPSKKRRMVDTLVLSNHRRDRREDSEKTRRSKEGVVDALTISKLSTTGKSSTRKLRSSSLSGPRQRRASTKKNFLEGSDATVDCKPKHSSSLKSISSRRCLSLDENSPSTVKLRKHRSLSKPKRSKKKSFDQSSHSATRDDEKSQRRPASVSRRRKKSLDCSCQRKRSSSVGVRKIDQESPSKRSSSMKRRKNKDQMNGSGHSQVLWCSGCRKLET